MYRFLQPQNLDAGQARWRHQGLPEDAAHSPSPCPPWPLLGSVHFLLLVFLKVPVLLGMLRAALWVNRPLRSSADRQSQSIYKNW